MTKPISPHCRYKTIEEIWREDKKMLLRSGFVLPGTDNTVFLSEEEYDAIVSAADPTNADASCIVTQDHIDALVAETVPHIEAIFGDFFSTRPTLNLFSSSDYAAHYRWRSEDLARRLGGQLVSPGILPPVTSFPHASTISICDKIPLLDEEGNVIRYVPWSRPRLEYALITGISNMLFHQLRGEWKEGYVRSCAALSQDDLDLILYIRGAIVHHTSEALALSTNPSWAIHHVDNKLDTVYADSTARFVYAAVGAFTAGRTLAQIAMADIISMEGSPETDVSVELSASFLHDHPYHRQKFDRFQMPLS